MSKASALYVLHEAASGYALFDVVELDEVASLTPELQAAIADANGVTALVTMLSAPGQRASELAAVTIVRLCKDNGSVSR